MTGSAKGTAVLMLAFIFAPFVGAAVEGQATPRSQPGADMTVHTPEQHDLYDGRFVLSGGRVYQVGGLEDPPGWDHIGNDPGNLHPVEGTVEIDVNEIDNTVNPAAIQIDFFIRSPEGDARNNPTREEQPHARGIRPPLRHGSDLEIGSPLATAAHSPGEWVRP